MSAVADAIDFVLDLCADRTAPEAAKGSGYKAAVAFIYIMCGFLGVVTHHRLSDARTLLPFLLTASAFLQCLGFLLLAISVRARKCVGALSAKSLELWAMMLGCRLASTCVKNGYLPTDRTGDWAYQIADAVSLALVVLLLRYAYCTYKETYLEHFDTLAAWPLLPPCFLLAYCIHADLNNSPIFDRIWALSLNLETVMMLPQLWMLAQIGGRVDCLTAHFVACVTASRALACIFWLSAFRELAAPGEANVAGKQIVAAYALQLLCSADFAWYYLKGLVGGHGVVLPEAVET